MSGHETMKAAKRRELQAEMQDRLGVYRLRRPDMLLTDDVNRLVEFLDAHQINKDDE